LRTRYFWRLPLTSITTTPTPAPMAARTQKLPPTSKINRSIKPAVSGVIWLTFLKRHGCVGIMG
jgi:hypothetical protein